MNTNQSKRKAVFNDLRMSTLDDKIEFLEHSNKVFCKIVEKLYTKNTINFDACSRESQSVKDANINDSERVEVIKARLLEIKDSIEKLSIYADNTIHFGEDYQTEKQS